MLVREVQIDVEVTVMSLPRLDRAFLPLQLLDSCWTLAEGRPL